MNFLGGIIGDAMKEGPSGLVGGIVGDRIKKDPRGLIGGLAGEMIDDPRDLLYRPGVDKFEIRQPIFRPGVDSFEVEPLNFLNRTLEQNKEVMGPKEQVFPRFADPNDGTLKNPMMVAADPSFVIPKEVSPQQVNEINRRVISDYDRKKEMLRRGLLAPLLRGV